MLFFIPSINIAMASVPLYKRERNDIPTWKQFDLNNIVHESYL